MRTDHEIIESTEALAARFADIDGFIFSGKNFRESENPRAKKYWAMACAAQENLTATDVSDAIENVTPLQLLDCPFCGSKAQRGGGSFNGGSVSNARCSNAGCIASFKSVELRVWNTRNKENSQ